MNYQQQSNPFSDAFARVRSRQSWNERLTHWEKPASDSEEDMIERAASNIRKLMPGNAWLTSEGVQIAPQGSYHNNTNVRQESDLDLRAVHPSIRVEYAQDVRVESANVVLGYTFPGPTLGQIVAQMRSEMASMFTRQFGALNVETDGNKAIRVKSVPGSRAPVDVVPCSRLHYVRWDGYRYVVTEGVAIQARDGTITFNFPDQHHGNGIQKRARTQLRFKRNVRMLKRLRDELVEGGAIKAEEVPSFLVECLVYAVEDSYFLVETDDRYDRLLRVVTRIHEQLNDASWVGAAREINGVKLLFGSHQGWTLDAAKKFSAEAWVRLMA
jgi:hypothetical protein